MTFKMVKYTYDPYSGKFNKINLNFLNVYNVFFNRKVKFIYT